MGEDNVTKTRIIEGLPEIKNIKLQPAEVGEDRIVILGTRELLKKAFKYEPIDITERIPEDRRADLTGKEKNKT